MEDVLGALGSVAAAPADPDAVHDVRVALRRCRSVAAAMTEIDAHPDWHVVQRRSRRLFHALGALRDVQVLEQWIEALTVADDPARRAWIDNLRTAEEGPRERVRRAVGAFDRKGWKRLTRQLTRRLRFVPAQSAAAQCLALERFRELRTLHVRVVRAEAPRRWHRLRIALKRFRYIVEAFLPERSAAWRHDLKQIQDLLGKLHDLHGLQEFIGADEGMGPSGAVTSLRATVDAARRQCMAEYRARMHERGSMLRAWRAGLPRGRRIHAATAMRFRATARALDPRAGHTIRVARFALRLFDAIGSSGVAPQFRDARTRTMFRSAARLHGIRHPSDRRSRQKAAYRILRDLPVPIGWRACEWTVLAWTVRYHRGAEPKATHTSFARLPAERQDLVRGLAGVLRLARALHRHGATTIACANAATGGDLRLRIAGLSDARKTAERVAGAKHLLESYVGRQLIIDRV